VGGTKSLVTNAFGLQAFLSQKDVLVVEALHYKELVDATEGSKLQEQVLKSCWKQPVRRNLRPGNVRRKG
jgi:hypothetical protein